VRVHSVLKQQKSKGPSDVQGEEDKIERLAQSMA